MTKILFVFLACLAATEGFFFGPLHASCNLDWTFNLQCSEVEQILVRQIKSWKGFDDCGTGEKCGYDFVSESSDTLKATHTTPVSKYVDDLDFTFTQDGQTCKVHGHSTSETWYAVLDYGTNYCNLRNLVDGSGLSKMGGFSETTNDGICTQYSKRNCDKY